MQKHFRNQAKKKNGHNHNINHIDNNLRLQEIKPITSNQTSAFRSFYHEQNLVLHGTAGTGKTFISLYLALADVLERTEFKHVIIIRSAVPTRQIGYVPGNLTEKSKQYELPYPAIVNELFGRGDAYDILKNKKTIQFLTTSNIRGITLDNSIIVVDEFQNMDAGELHTVMTRVGTNSKIIFCGDTNQDDLTRKRYNEESGINCFRKILAKMKEFDTIEFDTNDIVRSNLLKSYIIARENYELSVPAKAARK